MEQHDQAEDSPARESSAPLNIVTIPCTCPKVHHEFDTVTLHSEVPLDLGVAAAWVIRRATDEAVVLGQLSRVFLRFGVSGWSLTGPDGKALPITPESIEERLTYSAGGFEVSEAANALYASAVMRPLLAARARSSQNGQPAASTPPRTDSGPKHPEPSKPSSPSDTAGSLSEVPAR